MKKLLTLLLAMLISVSWLGAQDMTAKRDLKKVAFSKEKEATFAELGKNVKKSSGETVRNTFTKSSRNLNAKAVILSEDFEGGVLPTGWTTLDGDNAWTISNDNSSSYWTIPSHTIYASINDDAGGSAADNSDTYIATPPMNFTSLVAPIIEFESLPKGGTFTLKASTDGGTNWSDITTFSSSSTWFTESENLTSLAGEGSVIIAFHYNDGGNWSYGWAIDDIVVYEPEPYEFSVTYPEGVYVNAGESHDYTVTIENTGTNADDFTPAIAGVGTWTYGLFEADGTTPLVGAITIASGASVDYIIRAAVPLGATFGDTDTENFSVTSAETGKAIENFSITTTASTVITLDYYTDFNGSLTGWQSVSMQGGKNFTWSDDPESYAGFAMPFTSTTAANGFALFDNLNGTGLGPNPAEAALVSPEFDLTGETYISMTFEHLARQLGSGFGAYPDLKLFVEASTDNFVADIQEAWSYQFPAEAHLSISGKPVVNLSAFAGQSSVKFRLRYLGGGGYWWLIDDINIFAVPANDIAVDNVVFSNALNTAGDDVTLTANITNVGGAAQTGVAVTFNVDGNNLVETIATIAAAQTVEVTTTWSGATAGRHLVTVTVPLDDDNTNNLGTTQGVIAVTGELAEGFEGTWIPRGWQAETNWGEVTEPSWIYEGLKAASCRNASGFTDTKLITPMLTVGAGDELNYYAQVGNPIAGLPTTIQVMSSPDNVTWTAIGSLVELTNISTLYTVDLSSLTGDYYFAFSATGAPYPGGSYSTHAIVDHVVGPAIKPLAPEAVTLTAPAEAATDVANMPTLSWTAATTGGIPTGYKVYLDQNADPIDLIETANESPYTLTSALLYNTTYYWKVVATNAVNDAPASDIWSFTTMADPTLTPPFTEEFAAFPPLNWTQATGILDVATTLTGTTSAWMGDNFGNTGSDKAVRVNIYNEKKEWFFTPPIDISGVADYQLEFDIALTPWSGTAAATLGVDDYIAVVISTDNGVTWSNTNTLMDWVSTDAISPTGDHHTINISTYSGIVKFGFYVRRPSGTSPDLKLFFDNVQVREIPTTPIFSITPTEKDFGSLVVGSTNVQEFTITNTGVGTMTIAPADITINGANAADFVLDAVTETFVLASGESGVITVTFDPQTVGDKAANLQVIDNIAKATNAIPLTGTALPEGSLVEGFESATFPPVGWANPGSWSRSTTSPYEGVASAYKWSTDTENLLVTPIVTITGTSTLDFFARTSSANANQRIQIKYSADAIAWTNIGSEISLPSAGPWTGYSVDLSTIPGDYYLAFAVYNVGGGGSVYVDYVTGPLIKQFAPDAVTLTAPADAATGVSNMPTLSWTAAATGGIPTGYKVYLDQNPDPITLIETANESPYTLTSLLLYNTTYYWKVVATNSVDDAPASDIRSFTTMADPTLYPPFAEDFETFPPTNWTQFRGLLDDPVTVAGTTSGWSVDGFANVGTTGAAKLNIYGTSRREWLVTAPIDLGDGTVDYQLTFDLALTKYGNTNAPDPSGIDDRFAVVISTDNGLTWTSTNALAIWNNSGDGDFVYNDISLTGESIVLDLSPYSGIVKIGFYGESTISNADNEVFIDNVSVIEIPTVPIVAVTPAVKDFGQVETSYPSTPQVFVIKNIGPGTLTVQAPTLDNITDYTLSFEATDYPAALTGDASVTFEVVFNPQTEAVLTGEVSIVHDAAGSPATVSLTGEGFTRPAGSHCGNPYFATLPLVDYTDNTEAYGNDYNSAMIDPTSNYLNGYDFVAQFTLTEKSLLTGSVSGSWTGLIIVEDCPNTVTPAARLALGSGSSGGSLSVVLDAGTYFAIVSTYPSPNFTDFTLNISAVPAYELVLEVNPIEDPVVGIVTGQGFYAEGAIVTIAATANAGYALHNWTNAAAEVVSENANFDYTMGAGNVVLTANFIETREIVSVGTIAPISVIPGTLYGDIPFPATADVTLDGEYLGSTTATLDVTWDGGTPTYDADVIGDYVFEGTLALENGILNTINATASITVTVAKGNPVITTWPVAANEITYGETLADAGLDVAGAVADVDGTFTFQDDTFIPEYVESGYSATVIFTPTNTDSYNTVEGTVLVTVNKLGINVISAVATNKVYDGNTTATITGAELDGVIAGDEVVLGNDTEGTFAQATVGTGIDVTVAMTISGADIGNYALTQPDDLKADITQKELTVINAVAVNKIYDRNTSAIITGAELNGVVGGDIVVLEDHTTGTFSQFTVGTNLVVSTTMNISGGDALNYSLTQPNYLTADITKFAINVIANDQIKKAGTEFIFGGTEFTVDPATIAPDAVTSVTLFSDGAGIGAPIQEDPGYAIMISDAVGVGLDNYDITYVNGNFDVTDKAILSLPDLVAASKVYDGTRAATITTYGLLAGIEAGAPNVDFDATAAVAQFATAGAETAKIVTVTGLVLTGEDASSYKLATIETTADITQKGLDITADSKTKVYGDTDPALTVTYDGFVTGQDENNLLGNLVIGRDAGENLGDYVIIPSGYTSQNYAITYTTGTFSISQRAITIAADAKTKVYGETDPGLTYEITTGDLAFTDEFDGELTREIGENIGDYEIQQGPLTIVNGPDNVMANYNFAYTPSSLTINAKELTVINAVAESKVYDKSDVAVITGAELSEVVTGDDVTLMDGNVGTFDQVDVGTDISVTTAMSITGDIGNYTLTQPDYLKANITAKEITVINAVAESKVYDKLDVAVITGAELSGVVTGDDVTLVDGNVGTFDQVAVGTDIPVSTTMSITGDIANYTFTQPTGFTADITAKPLAVISAIATDKVYDGTTAAVITGAELDAVITGDVVVLDNATVGTFAQAAIGTDIEVTTAMTISGADAANYELSGQPAGLTANITAAELTIGGTFTANDKLFDGTVTAVINPAGLTLIGVVADETVTLTNVVAEFADALVGVDKVVTIVSADIDGADKDNYTLSLVGAPTATATIYLEYSLALVANPTEGGTVTGAEGNYQAGTEIALNATPAAAYTFENWTNGTTVVSTVAAFNYTMPAENTTLTANFELIPVYNVTLTVVEGEGENATPIEGATVTFDGVDYTTGADGIVIIADLVDGNYAYTVTMTGYDDAAGEIVVDGANVEETITLTLKTYSVTLTVVEGETPIEGATVTFDGVDYTTGADGITTITDIVDGTYAYTVTMTGYDDAAGEIVVDGADVAETIELTLTTYTVTLTIVESENATPVEGATVTFDEVDYTTDVDGIVAITDLVDGTYAYTVTMDKYDDTTGEIVVEGADVAETIELVLTGVNSELFSNLKVYPNPFSDKITINNGDWVNRVIVTNIVGQRVMDINLNGLETIDTSELTNGVYLVTFEGANGERAVRKMIKK